MRLPTDPMGPDAGHIFTVGIGAVLRDGAPFAIDWSDKTFAAGNLLFNALMYNAAGYTGYDPTPCRINGACTFNDTGAARQFGIPPINVTLTFPFGASSAEESTVLEIDLSP